ncbi:MAG: hypothetical protein P8Y71_27930 [Pseudolabrys sp.]
MPSAAALKAIQEIPAPKLGNEAARAASKASARRSACRAPPSPTG